ncbi:MAG TPA: lysophospholipid acyltransferase family protein [Polyangiales bacterium]|nr:lysophospholipid acyltransferase family protein [Polyangiales bacterium]
MPSLDIAAARSGARALGMGTLTVSMLAGVSVHEWLSAPEAQRPIFQRWMKAWAHSLLKLFGVRAAWSGATTQRATCARLIVSNHRSPLDILLLLQRFGGVVLSRADLANWPVLGPAARRAETIFVDRENTLSGVLAVRALRDRLSQQHTVIVFPEGTTVAGDEVRPFQQGAFAAARGLPVEVVPVGIAYPPGSEFLDETFTQHMTRMARRPRTEVACVVGQPQMMPAARKAVAEQLRADVQDLVHQARKQLDARATGRG